MFISLGNREHPLKWEACDHELQSGTYLVKKIGPKGLKIFFLLTFSLPPLSPLFTPPTYNYNVGFLFSVSSSLYSFNIHVSLALFQ